MLSTPTAMASEMPLPLPLPLPPRTPTPPPDNDNDNHDRTTGLGLGQASQQQQHPSPLKLGYNLDGLSSLDEDVPMQQFGSLATPSLASPRTPSGYASSNISPSIPYPAPSISSESEEQHAQNPFNFQTVAYTAGKAPPSTKPDQLGRRRGHKYKHSSVSHQIFLEPPPNRAPLQLPASLPIPTWKEFWSSMSREQALRGSWCFCHLSVAAFVFWGTHESLALTVLSRLLFFDALGAFLCVAVDVGGNFEAWKRSSIRHPFGFERSEVVAGLGMSVGLLFMGLDLISHSMTHALENKGGHVPHHAHSHERVSPGTVDLAALSAIGATLTSALVLKNHARIGKVMRLGYFSSLPSILSNPSHFLTLSCSALLLMLPLLSIQLYVWLDRTLALSVAISMIVLGWHMGWRLGKMLMMSYSGPGVEAVLYDVQADPSVAAIEEAKFWQVHYGLCQANLKLKVRNMEDVNRLRERVTSLVRNHLGGGYGSGGQRWEVSTQLTLDHD